MPNMETAKTKKPAKVPETQPKAEVKKSDSVPIQEKEKGKREPPVKAAVINNRRRTICASTFAVADDGSGLFLFQLNIYFVYN